MPFPASKEEKGCFKGSYRGSSGRLVLKVIPFVDWIERNGSLRINIQERIYKQSLAIGTDPWKMEKKPAGDFLCIEEAPRVVKEQFFLVVANILFGETDYWVMAVSGELRRTNSYAKLAGTI